jgi:hypothetical protein
VRPREDERDAIYEWSEPPPFKYLIAFTIMSLVGEISEFEQRGEVMTDPGSLFWDSWA